MKLALGVLSLCLAALSSGATAQQLSWYLGAELASVRTKVDDKTGTDPNLSGTARANGLRLKAGTHVLPWLDVELQFILPRDETYSTVTFAGNTIVSKVETGVVALFAKPHHQVGPVDLYALVGFSTSTHEFSGGLGGEQKATDISYGVGMQYKFTPKLALSIDWARYTKKDFPVFGGGSVGAEVSAFGVGLNYTF